MMVLVREADPSHPSWPTLTARCLRMTLTLLTTDLWATIASHFPDTDHPLPRTMTNCCHKVVVSLSFSSWIISIKISTEIEDASYLLGLMILGLKLSKSSLETLWVSLRFSELLENCVILLYLKQNVPSSFSFPHYSYLPVSLEVVIRWTVVQTIFWFVRLIFKWRILVEILNVKILIRPNIHLLKLLYVDLFRISKKNCFTLYRFCPW